MDDFDRNAIHRGITRRHRHHRRRMHGSGNVWSVRAVWSTDPKPHPGPSAIHPTDRSPPAAPERTAPVSTLSLNPIPSVLLQISPYGQMLTMKTHLAFNAAYYHTSPTVNDTLIPAHYQLLIRTERHTDGILQMWRISLSTEDSLFTQAFEKWPLTHRNGLTSQSISAQSTSITISTNEVVLMESSVRERAREREGGKERQICFFIVIAMFCVMT